MAGTGIGGGGACWAVPATNVQVRAARMPTARYTDSRRIMSSVAAGLQADSKPTRAVNAPATTSVPSATFSGSAGRLRGAGPSITFARLLGSNFDEWHEQYSTCSSASHSSTSQPECVQIVV